MHFFGPAVDEGMRMIKSAEKKDGDAKTAKEPVEPNEAAPDS